MPIELRDSKKSAEDALTEEKMTPPVLVDRPELFQELVSALLDQPVIALDTESNSLYRYFYRVCLIQISTPEVDYLVDPLALHDLSALGNVLASPGVQKVFHAAENDILMLKRDFGFNFTNVFDTMLAARILGWPQVGLASILRDKFGLTLDKRAQLTDWGQRPLTKEQMAYARLDSRYLLPLRDLLAGELQARKRWREAQENFSALPQISYVEKPFDPDGFWRIKGARDLRPDQLAVLRELYLWRDQQARAVDRPPFKVLGDDLLVALAQKQPARSDELRLSPRQIEHFARGILAAIARGVSAPAPVQPPRSPNGSRPDPQVIARFDRLRAWRSKRAAERAVDADIVLNNDNLMAIARSAPSSLEQLDDLGILGPWKLEEYGADLLRVLSAG